MNFQHFILIFLILFYTSCQKESKSLPKDLDQLIKIEKEIQNQRTINCNSTIGKKLCEHNWYFDFDRTRGSSFAGSKNKDGIHYFPFTFFCDGTTLFNDIGNNHNKKVFWKIEDNQLIIELTYLSNYSDPSVQKTKHTFEFEFYQNNSKLEIKNTSKSVYHFLTYFIGTGCEG